MGDDKSQMQIN